jgi:hypothetical protein
MRNVDAVLKGGEVSLFSSTIVPFLTALSKLENILGASILDFRKENPNFRSPAKRQLSFLLTSLLSP